MSWRDKAQAAADELRAEERRLEAELERVRTLRAQIESQLGEALSDEGLTGIDPERTIRTMDVNPGNATAAVKRAIGRATRKHLAQVKLYEKGVTITALAAELGETRARVSSWFADGDANRAVPERHVETMRKKYGIPRSAWTRIAS